jgi:hypothetical protein
MMVNPSCLRRGRLIPFDCGTKLLKFVRCFISSVLLKIVGQRTLCPALTQGTYSRMGDIVQRRERGDKKHVHCAVPARSQPVYACIFLRKTRILASIKDKGQRTRDG